MRKVERSELLELGPYEGIRDRFRARIIALKASRRLALGPNMTLVFENHDTVLWQIQEMLRTERISDARSIAHELATYNELVPGKDQLSATLFIEYDDPTERGVMLGKLAGLRTAIKLKIGAHECTARFATHYGEEADRLPSVNYLLFDTVPGAAAQLRDASVPASLTATHPDYGADVELPRTLRAQLADDLEEP